MLSVVSLPQILLYKTPVCFENRRPSFISLLLRQLTLYSIFSRNRLDSDRVFDENTAVYFKIWRRGGATGTGGQLRRTPPLGFPRSR